MGNKDTTTATSSDVDPDALRQAEFLQTQMILDSLIGKTVAAAKVEETRIAVSTTDGTTFFFYGFMGARSQNEGS
jgi:hypothetical protein